MVVLKRKPQEMYFFNKKSLTVIKGFSTVQYVSIVNQQRVLLMYSTQWELQSLTKSLSSCVKAGVVPK